VSIARTRDGRRVRRRAPTGARGQRGVALLLVLLAIVVAAGYAGLRGLSVAYAKPERDARTLAAMQQAKQALLGYAANRGRLLGLSPSSQEHGSIPGPLPCPAASLATSNSQFGRARTTCNADSAFPQLLVGRLPWRTLEIPELTDGTGEGLWYAVSSTFRYQGDATALVNLESQGMIRLVDNLGATIQSRVVAVIIAPGAAIPEKNQQRSSTTDLHTASNFLERFAAITPTYDLEFYGGRPNQAPYSRPAGEEPFNDLILTITEAELQDAIDTAIAMRMRDSIFPILEAHRAFWKTLPYATGSFVPTLALEDIRHASVTSGTPGKLYGQIPTGPLPRNPGAPLSPLPGPPDLLLAYQTPVSLTPTGTPAAGVTCEAKDNARRVDCTLTGGSVSTPAYFHVEVVLANVNAGVFDKPGVTASLPSSISPDIVSASPVGNTLDATVSIRGSITAPSVQVSVGLPKQRLTSAATSLDPEWWFVRASWPKFVYYARCVDASTPCMAITDATGALQPPARAALVYAGRAVLKSGTSMQARPASNDLDEYFESPHDTLPLSNGATVPAFRRGIRSGAFNDRVVAMP
jgi:type II secretory pathway pseudopilin PulG